MQTTLQIPKPFLPNIHIHAHISTTDEDFEWEMFQNMHQKVAKNGSRIPGFCGL